GAMRVLVFDQDRAPNGGWQDRWERKPGEPSPVRGRVASTAPSLALRANDTLTYRHFLVDSGKCEPLRDEYAYNGGLHADSECVHDFLIETEIEATGRGALSLRLCDGRDWVEVVVPVGANRSVEVFAWPID